jgi:hypothetical protein
VDLGGVGETCKCRRVHINFIPIWIAGTKSAMKVGFSFTLCTGNDAIDAGMTMIGDMIRTQLDTSQLFRDASCVVSRTCSP